MMNFIYLFGVPRGLQGAWWGWVGGGEASVIFASLFCDAEDGTQSLMYARHDCH